MIIDFKINYNNYEEQIKNNYSILEYICPKCGAKHSFIRHGFYKRNICIINHDETIIENNMTILRVKCTSCGSTHAILPNDIIPYCIYSFSTIINVLIKHYVEKEKIPDIAKNLSLSFQLIYNFISRFLEFLNSCFIVLKNLNVLNVLLKPSEIIENINKYNLENNFLYKYFFYMRWPFLMTKFHNILSPKIFIGGHGY